MEDVCIVCAEPLQFTAYGSCGHKEACSKCVLRLRSVLPQASCLTIDLDPSPGGSTVTLYGG